MHYKLKKKTKKQKNKETVQSNLHYGDQTSPAILTNTVVDYF